MYIVFDFVNNDFDFMDTEKQAKKQAEETLEYYRGEAATDGWPDNIEKSIGYAEVKMMSKITKTETKEEYGEDWPYDFDEIWHIDLVAAEGESIS